MVYQKSKKHLDNLAKAREKLGTKICQWCHKNIHVSGFKKHEEYCYFKPTNLRICPVCSSVIKGRSVTCSKSCANTHFRSNINHPNWKNDSYRSTCFYYHPKKCLVCSETRIVEVHHIDGNNKNNDPCNLAPLCPTHHRYWHSRYRHLVEDIVDRYITDFKINYKGIIL